MANLKRRIEKMEAAAVAAGGGHSVEIEPAWIAKINRGFTLYKQESRTGQEQAEMLALESELQVTMAHVAEICAKYI